MPTRLLLEGHDIEELLERIRAEHGPEARIVQADKVRSGGVAGFFAKEHYEVEIEIEEPAGPGDRAASVAAAEDPFLALARRAEESERLSSRAPAGPPQEAASAEETTPVPGGSRSPASVWGVPAGAPVAEAAGRPAESRGGAADEEFPTEEAAERFASILARLATAAENDEAAADPDRPVVPPVFAPLVAQAGQSTAKPRKLPVVEEAAAEQAPVAAGKPRTRKAGASAQDAPEPAVDPSGSAPASATEAQPEETTVNAEPMSKTARAGSSGASAERSLPRVSGVVAGEAAQPRVAAAPPKQRKSRAGSKSQRPVPTAAQAEVLHALGLPEKFVGTPKPPVAPTAGMKAVAALSLAIQALPAPPKLPQESGNVVLVVGDGTWAHDAARDLAVELRQDPHTVSLISETDVAARGRRARGEEGTMAALEKVRQLRAADTPAVLALDIPMGARRTEWVRDILGVSGPTAVWAVVDATRKTTDLAAHLQRLGKVDALIVHNASATSDPGTVLDLGIPVAVIDGRRATRAAWTALLTARLFGEEE